MITFDEHPSYCCCLCMQSCCSKTSISNSLLSSFNRREPSPRSCPRPSWSIVVYTLVIVPVGVEYCLQSSSRWSHRPYSILYFQLHCIDTSVHVLAHIWNFWTVCLILYNIDIPELLIEISEILSKFMYPWIAWKRCVFTLNYQVASTDV